MAASVRKRSPRSAFWAAVVWFEAVEEPRAWTVIALGQDARVAAVVVTMLAVWMVVGMMELGEADEVKAEAADDGDDDHMYARLLDGVSKPL